MRNSLRLACSRARDAIAGDHTAKRSTSIFAAAARSTDASLDPCGANLSDGSTWRITAVRETTRATFSDAFRRAFRNDCAPSGSRAVCVHADGDRRDRDHDDRPQPHAHRATRRTRVGIAARKDRHGRYVTFATTKPASWGLVASTSFPEARSSAARGPDTGRVSRTRAR